MNPLTVGEIQALLDSSPMIRFMGVRVTQTAPEASTARFTLPMRPELERLPGTGQYHGGAIANFIDTAGDFAVALFVGAPVPTMNLRIDYLRAASGARLDAVAVVRRLGRTIAVVDVDVFDGESRLVAIGRGTYGSSVAPGSSS